MLVNRVLFPAGSMTAVKLLILFTTRMTGGADITYGTPVVAEALRRGWDVHTACSDRPDLQPLVDLLAKLGTTHHRCELVEEPYGRLRYRAMNALYARRARKLIESVNADRVLLVLPYMTYGLGIMQACRRVAVPTVTVYQLVKPQSCPAWRAARIRELLTTHCAPVAVSDNNRQILCRLFGMEPEQINLIYNGITVTPRCDSADRGAVRARIRTELGIPDTSKMQVKVGVHESWRWA